jgi:hypothetical protein
MPNAVAHAPLELTFYLESPVGVRANAASAYVKWKMGAHGEEAYALQYENDEIGEYVFTVTPTSGGLLYAEFRAEEPEFRKSMRVAVSDAEKPPEPDNSIVIANPHAFGAFLLNDGGVVLLNDNDWLFQD